MIKQMLQAYFAPALTLVFLVVMVARNPLFNKRRKQLFYWAIGLLGIMIATSWGDCALMGRAPTAAVLIARRLAFCLHFGFSPAAPMVLALIHRKEGREKWWFFLPEAVTLAANLVSFFNGCVVQVTNQNTVELGSLYFLPYLTGGLYLLLLLSRAMDQHYRPNRQAEGAFITGAIIVFAGTIILEVVFSLRFILWSEASAFLVLYFLQLTVEKVAFDPLTGTHSAVAFSNMMEKVRGGRDCTIAMVDMNGLKYINDTFGHSAGNEALKQMSGAVLSAAEGHHMRVYRHGGDEFMVVSLRLCREEMEQILETALTRCGEVEGMPVTFAYGVTEFRSGGDLRAAVTEADERMYAHKKATSPMKCRGDHSDLDDI